MALGVLWFFVFDPAFLCLDSCKFIIVLDFEKWFMFLLCINKDFLFNIICVSSLVIDDFWYISAL